MTAGRSSARKNAFSENVPVPNPKTPLELARRLFEQSPLTVARIAGIVGIHESSLYRIARRQGWKPRKVGIFNGNDRTFARRFHMEAAGAAKSRLKPAEVARAFVGQSPEALAAEREAIVGRLWDKARVEIAKKEEREANAHGRGARRAKLREMDAHVRALEQLDRAVRRLVALREFRKKQRG